jgi:hypothetical protein
MFLSDIEKKKKLCCWVKIPVKKLSKSVTLGNNPVNLYSYGTDIFEQASCCCHWTSTQEERWGYRDCATDPGGLGDTAEQSQTNMQACWARGILKRTQTNLYFRHLEGLLNMPGQFRRMITLQADFFYTHRERQTRLGVSTMPLCSTFYVRSYREEDVCY